MNDLKQPAAGAESQPPAASPHHELEFLQRQWWCFLALGITQILFGTIAIGSAVFVSVALVVLFGLLLLVSGITQIVSAFWAGKWSGLFIHLLIGLLYVVVGFFVIDAPVESTLALTLVVAVFLIVSGLIRIVSALMERFQDWGWVLLNGIVALILGLLIYRHWPVSGAWVIGLFVGIEMVFNGWTWVMLALGLRKVGQSAQALGDAPAA